ncbi:exodeoxyribonuclease VIII [Enterobacter sp. kpr-6]|uniref:RecE family exodeoxyribonuclease n=1 Tax=Enterobacter sp. kpr-6 TaxID=1761782 RepID=UPI0008E70BAD|nr:RecE family exodeoxyribonuclease [Enterobacter sp. kpr-6]SFQ98880.1 exodeoxyribonuclease VIII [Enterobacter sp. kpr-6]
MEFFHLLKASQKSGKKDAVIWFTAKSAARANLQLDVALEDAEIETGRGKDYAKPIRTDFPVYNNLPEEGVVDFAWCDRYELADDQRTWNIILKAEEAPQNEMNPADSVPAQPDATVDSSESTPAVPVENRNPAVRFAIHLLGDKYQSHVTKEQHMAASEMALDEGNTYLQSLLRARNDIPEAVELSLNAEWKLIQAIKDIFSPDEEHEPAAIAVFMSAWVNADAGDRNQLVKDWFSGHQPAAQNPETDASGDEKFSVEKCRETPLTELHTVAALPFRQRLLAQFLAEKEFSYHIDNDQLSAVRALESDTDNSFVQNLLLAAENVEGLKDVREYDLWKLTDAVKEVFPADKKAPDLGLVLQFMKAWSATSYVDRGLLVKEWVKGCRVALIQRTDVKICAGGGNKTDRNPTLTHTLDTLDIEIALATLPMDFNIHDIPGGVFRHAKEIVSKKESPFKEWSAALRKRAGILDYSRAAIFALIRGAEQNVHSFPELLSRYINKNLTESDHEHPTEETLAAAGHVPEKSWENEVMVQVAAEQKAAAEQPKIASMGNGVFSIDGLMDTPSNEVAKPENAESITNVQMETDHGNETENGDAVPEGEAAVLPDESAHAAVAETVPLTTAEILAAAAPTLARQEDNDVNQNAKNAHQDDDSALQNTPKVNQIETEAHQAEPVAEYPAYFEPGRYEGLPNNVYHAANGISSTMVKDARVSLMYFNARHVAKTIPREGSKVLDMGNLVHALALQPENLDEEFSVEPVIPEGAFTTAATLRAFIDEHNASLPAQLSADDIKALLEEYNATLPAPVPMSGDKDAIGLAYLELPSEFKRIVGDDKNFTVSAMKACIKEYNATLPAPVKTSGSRDALYEQLAIINPDLVEQEAQKPAPLKVSGTKAEMIQAVKSVKTNAVFADELLDAWRENPGDKILVTQQQMQTALAIQKALHEHPTAGKLLLHPDRAVETSYFGIDEETGLEIRVRPDLEIDIDAVRIGADLKTISMWNVKQSGLRSRLHREIIDRDYHLSAAMYMNTAALDQFFWIFVNKDEGYHWIAIVEASEKLIELGMLEYRQTMNRIANAFDTGEWPAPIPEDYTDELNDFDLRRLEALRLA